MKGILTQNLPQNFIICGRFNSTPIILNHHIFCIDRSNLPIRQKEISLWAFVIVGLFGGIGRSVLVLLPIPGGFGSYAASLVEVDE